jgi:hypothetical protein
MFATEKLIYIRVGTRTAQNFLRWTKRDLAKYETEIAKIKTAPSLQSFFL